MLAPYVEAHGGPLLALGARSLGLYPAWIDDLRREGEDVEFALIGTLQIAVTSDRAGQLRRGTRGRWIEPTDVARAFPFLCPTAGAFSIEEHGYVDAPQLARGLARSAERHGATFRVARVERIEPHGDGLHVRADGDLLAAGRVIAAAGAWTNLLEGMSMPPVRPVRGQLLHVSWPGPRVPTILWGPGCYVVPRADGTLLVGATAEEAGFDERTTGAGVAGLLDAARQLLPALRDDALIEARVGLRPATPDELPVLGPDTRTPALVHASGHYRNGVLLAPLTAKLIADVVIDGRADPALESVKPDRFPPLGSGL
jgi:glycine oxidase